MNRKAEEFLLGTVTVKIVIALICVLILVYLGVQLYSMFGKNQDVKRAEDETEKLKNRIEIYAEQDTQTPMEVLFFPPEGQWYLRTYQKGYFPERQCIGRYQSCLCLCNRIGCDKLKGCQGMNQITMIDHTLRVPITPGSGVPSGSPGASNYPETIELKEKAVSVLQITKNGEIIIIQEKKEEEE